MTSSTVKAKTAPEVLPKDAPGAAGLLGYRSGEAAEKDTDPRSGVVDHVPRTESKDLQHLLPWGPAQHHEAEGELGW
jgi:hypothetical protein